MKNQKRTTTGISMDTVLLERVRAQGIRNLSGYISKLIRADLEELRDMSDADRKELNRLDRELEEVRKEWWAYRRRLKARAPPPEALHDASAPTRKKADTK